MTDNEYQCASCGGIFEKGRSDEEAAAASEAKFGLPVTHGTQLLCATSASR